MFQLLAKNLKVLLVWGVIIAAISGVVSFLIPVSYGADSQLLVIFRGGSATDQYSQVRSAELIGQTISQVMQTQDFYDKVMNQTNQNFDKTRWQNLSARDRQLKWKKDVSANMVYGTSLLKISAYSNTKDDALAFTNAIVQTVSSQSWQYVGSDVTFKVVDNPIISPWQTRPNIWLNIALGFVAGLILSTIWLVRYKRQQI